MAVSKSQPDLQTENAGLLRRVAELEKLQAEHKRVAEDLRIQKAYLEELFEGSPEAIVVLDINDRVLRINGEFTKMFGYAQDEAFGKPINELIVPPGLTREARTLTKKVKSGKRVSIETSRQNQDGTEISVSILGTPISFDGEHVAIYGIYRDITQSKRAEAALQESERRYKRLVNSITDYIYTVRVKQGQPVATSHGVGCVGVTGYASQEYDADPDLWYRMIHEADREAVTEQAAKILRQEVAPPLEHRIIHKDGSIRWVKNTTVPRFDEEGDLVAYDGLISDITERKQLEEELARAQRLETAGRIAGQIAHDFNNLLSPLSAYPALIREALPAENPLLDMVEEMEICAQRIAEINQQLLALGRRGHFTMNAIDLNGLIHKFVLSQDLPDSIKVRETLKSDLFLIKGGAAQLTRAFMNLIINAKEAMQDHGTLNIETRNVYLDAPIRGYKTIRRGEYVKLAFSDTGGGIAAEYLDQIFDPFFSTKKMDRTRGSGLGLSVVYGIMEDHNGYITVDSVPGKSTTFALYFPVSRELSKEEIEEFQKSRGGNETILVVDDDPVQWNVATHLLKRLGYKVHAVPSGEQAVAYVKKYPQDLLVLDMVMEGMDGTETYRKILEFKPRQKSIILSGYAMSKRVEEALRLGAGTYVTKPITPKSLATAVRNELDRKEPSEARALQ